MSKSTIAWSGCLLIVSLLALSSCKKEPAPAVTNVAVATPAAPPPPTTPPAPPAPEADAAAPKKGGDGLGDAYTANKKHRGGTRENDKQLERELAQLRPKNREYVSLDGKRIDVNFTGAKEGTGDFLLCDLNFELTDGTNSATTTMTDKKRDVSMTVGMGWCKVKVKPFLSEGKQRAIGTGQVRSRVTRAGRYDIVLLDANGKPMAIAQITEDRRLVAGHAYPGYQCFMRRDPEWEDQQIFSIVKVHGDSSKKVLQLRWNDRALTHHNVEDSTGNIFEYAFPAGDLEVIKPS